MSGRHSSNQRERIPMNDKRFYTLVVAGFLAFAMMMGTLAQIFGG